MSLSLSKSEESNLRVTVITSTSNNNLKLANQIGQHLEKRSCDFNLIDLDETVLPLYSPKAEKAGIPELAKELTTQLAESDGLIFVAPEYNGSIPPNITNLVAWVSRSSEDWRAAFNQKFAIVATHSGGGGLKVLEAMRRQLEHVGAVVLPRAIHTTYSKPAKEESLDAIFDQFVFYLKSTTQK